MHDCRAFMSIGRDGGVRVDRREGAERERGHVERVAGGNVHERCDGACRVLMHICECIMHDHVGAHTHKHVNVHRKGLCWMACVGVLS